MKNKKILLVVSFLLVCILNVYAQPGTIRSIDANSHLVKSLDGYDWKLKMMRPGQGEEEGLQNLFPEDMETSAWISAKVPGDIYTDLWNAGVIDDPYYGRNTVKDQWVQHYEWWYTKKFYVTEDPGDRIVSIKFDGVDYSCSVWLNGHFLGHHEGALTSFSYDVNKYLRVSKDDRCESSNMLTIRLDPPKQVNAMVQGQKAPWFGDYWQDLIPTGIYRSISMITTGHVRIKNYYARPLIHDNYKEADVEFHFTVENTSSASKKITFNTNFEGKNFKSEQQILSFTESVPPGVHKYIRKVKVNQPKLWWPWDLGKPNLYTAKVNIKYGNINMDYKSFNFGLRRVDMKWNPGFKKGVDLSFPRSCYINGKYHFIRSACWGGPPNIFVGRSDDDTYLNILKQAKEANLNDVRIFGWHIPELPVFYNICDSLGLTVWQDIVPLATGNISQDPKVVDGIISTAVSVLKERRNHPCLIKMEGGEELFLRTRDVVFARHFVERLGDSLKAYVDLPYIPDSPLTNPRALKAGYKPKEATHALAYFYSMGRWLMEDWYQRLDYPIIPEFAITSVPNVSSLKKFIPENEMWPPGLSWGHHWADFDKLRMQNFDTFGSEHNEELQDFVDATQISQGVIFQNGIEYFRRHKPHLSAVALCHLITYWPDMKWGLIDGYGQAKKSLEYVRRAYQPLLVNLDFKRRRWHKNENFKGSIWIDNDLYRTYKNCTVTIKVISGGQKVIMNKSYRIKKIEQNSASKYIDINTPLLNIGTSIKKFTGDENVSEAVNFASPELPSNDKVFYVILSLKNSEEKEISYNQYFFLIGDQAEATKKMNEMGKEGGKNISTYTYSNYYQFYPSINGKGKMRQSDKEIPRAAHFGRHN